MIWFDRQRNIIDFTLSSLMRRKGKNASLAVVYTLVVFLLASVMFFTHAIKKEASVILAEAPEVIVQKLMAGRHDLIPLKYAEQISEIRGVSAVRGRLWGYYYDAIFGRIFGRVCLESRWKWQCPSLTGRSLHSLRSLL